MAPGSDRRLNWSGLAYAAAAAPGLSLLAAVGLAFAGIPAGELQASAPPGPGGVVSILIFVVIVTVWGFAPALLFGAVTLWGLVRIVPHPSRMVLTIAGVVAAGLYVLTGLGLHELNPGVAFLLAPWTELMRTGSLADGLGLVIGILASGAAAGLLYAWVAHRG
jgi:hypothetical protein